jgi:hypothetical protein
MTGRRARSVWSVCSFRQVLAGGPWPAWTKRLQKTTSADFDTVQERDIEECVIAVEHIFR